METKNRALKEQIKVEGSVTDYHKWCY